MLVGSRAPLRRLSRRQSRSNRRGDRDNEGNSGGSHPSAWAGLLFGRVRAEAGVEETPGEGMDAAAEGASAGWWRSQGGEAEEEYGERRPLLSGRELAPATVGYGGGEGAGEADEARGPDRIRDVESGAPSEEEDVAQRQRWSAQAPLTRSLTPGPLASLGSGSGGGGGGGYVADTEEDEINFRDGPSGYGGVGDRGRRSGATEDAGRSGEGVDGNNAEDAGSADGGVRQSTADVAASDRAVIASLTSQLRCLFTLLTLPIIPLGTALTLLLLFVLHGALVSDISHRCSHPLKGYALLSLAVFSYAPQHRRLKRFIFRYSRERDGPSRPLGVRLFDQLYHTACLLYVYGGTMLMRSCAEDLVGGVGADGGSGGDVVSVDEVVDLAAHEAAVQEAAAAAAAGTFDPSVSTCEATCPSLYRSTKSFVYTLELFAIVLVLPLICLPCVYLWVVRRAGAAAALARLREMEDEDGNGGEVGGDGSAEERFTADDILDAMETVTSATIKGGTSVVPSTPPLGADGEGGAGECCICMTELRFAADDRGGGDTDEDTAGEAHALLQPRPADSDAHGGRNKADRGSGGPGDEVVVTKCGHLFHRECIGGWIGGRWSEEEEENGASPRQSERWRWRRRRARRRCCPLCREDLAPTERGSQDRSQQSRRSSLPSSSLFLPMDE